METDLLVIGTGIAGLSYAIKAASLAPEYKITVIAKDALEETNTLYAQGGIAAVVKEDETAFKNHISDTLTAGAGLCDPKIVKSVVKAAGDRIHELQQWGVVFDTTKQQQLHLIREGGHSEKRIVHHKDQTGKAVQKALLKKTLSFPNVKLYSNHILVDLITEHHLPKHYPRSCYGAYVISKTEQEILTIASKITVLSTGGGGQLYAYSTNTKGATADGLGAAYRAKAPLKQLPYVQFHPTVLYEKNPSQPLLLSEALRGAGALLRNAEGSKFMEYYDSRKELAPRDIVARAIATEIAKSAFPYCFLDCNPIGENKLKQQFPFLLKQCLSKGIALPKEWIPIVPAAHYFCGGIAVTSKGQTGLPHLFAIGECSCTGLHGANRLASNSLLESLVYAHRAAVEGVMLLKKSTPFPLLPAWKGVKYCTQKPSSAIVELKKNLQETMTNNMGIFKTTAGLKKAKHELKIIYDRVQNIYHEKQLTPEFCELRNMVGVAYLMVEQSLQLQQNHGTFYNFDYAK